LRVVYFGNREIGCACLEEILALGSEVPLVVTYPRDPLEAPGFRCLAHEAAARGLPVATPPDASGKELLRTVRDLAPDLLLSVYYGHRIPRGLRSIPRLGALNVHGSLLPRWRGRAPLPWVILAGDREAGVTLHEMVHAMDAGDVYGRERFPVGPRDTATDLYARTSAAARALLRRVLPLVEAGTAGPEPQDHARATFAPPLLPERSVDRTSTVERFDRVVRAFARPYPGARTPMGDDFAVIRAGEPGRRKGGIVIPLADGTYTVFRLSLEGAAEDDAAAFLAGHPEAPRILGVPAAAP
jgi:methionyl-tRNA formyltransferase